MHAPPALPAFPWLAQPLELNSRSVVETTRRTQLHRIRATLADGEVTTVHVAVHERARTRLRVQRLPGLTQLERWCADTGTAEAIVGGFYLRDGSTAATGGTPLGELWVEGERLASAAFSRPWDATRACVFAHRDDIRLARRDDLPAVPAGHLLQAGPLLVRDGAVVTGDDEGFSAGAHQFDSDITDGRHPRAALGLDDSRLIAAVCDGRAASDCGLTISELADLMLALGCEQALNLDGGGSTTLVSGRRLVNAPRETHGISIAGGRAIATACVFEAA